MGPKSGFWSYDGSMSDLYTQLEVAQQIFASILKYIELCKIPHEQIPYMLNTIQARSWAGSIAKGHKEKREHSEEYKGTNGTPLKQYNNKSMMKDNLTSIMSVVCPNHLSAKKRAHKTC